MRVAIFDLDGTLADTSADLIAAANGALAAAGLGTPLDPARDRSLAFAGGRAMLREGLARRDAQDEAEVDRLYPRLLEIYAGKLAVHTRTYEGAEAALERLAADGWRLGICTNKPERLAILLLEALGIRERFAAVLGADTLHVRKPDPLHFTETARRIGADPLRSVMIGDTLTDLTTARRAGVPCVLTGFGFAAEPMDELAPDAVVAHFDELPAVLERLSPVDRPARGQPIGEGAGPHR
jgi:phosphoglycolate phosphatase